MIYLDLMNESRKKTYRETLEKDNDIEKDLNNDIMGK